MGVLGSSEDFMLMGSLDFSSRSLVKDLTCLLMRASFFYAFTFDAIFFSYSCIFQL